jgi:UDP-N-acetylglucosamine 2-epimerase (non-hydrolysing)/GDP/UDP-N,N'-diacetylbacillosamine 2-epimerase (hydrolysing)
MKLASVLVGNSSSGIIEAPSFGLSVVNIGTRQVGRQRAENVIDVDYNKDEIETAVKKALCDEEFREKVKNCKNPYGDGKAGKRIAKILSQIKVDKKLLQKRMTY